MKLIILLMLLTPLVHAQSDTAQARVSITKLPPPPKQGDEYVECEERIHDSQNQIICMYSPE